jgi:hypothetical protein
LFCSAKNLGITEATQINCILFCRAAKIFGICQPKLLKLAAFCSAAHPKVWDATKSTAFCSAARRKNSNCEQEHPILLSRLEKIFGIYQQKHNKVNEKLPFFLFTLIITGEQMAVRPGGSN